MLHEGQKVAHLTSGDHGSVLARADDESAHVMWSTGALAGQVTLEFDSDLVGVGQRGHIEAAIDDSLEVGGFVVEGVRQIYDVGGATGLLNAMAEGGHLAAFGDIAEGAVEFISGQIRRDPSFRAATAQLDPEEGEGLIRLASFALLRDAFGVVEE